MTRFWLHLTRSQILAYRREVGALDKRLGAGALSVGRGGWAGLQDGMPRADLLAIHARVEGTHQSTWEDPSLVQIWGPHFSVFVVAARDVPVFTLGRYPDDVRGRRRAEDLAARLRALLGESRRTYSDAGHALGVRPTSLKYASATGTVLIRWEGAGRPTLGTVPPPEDDPGDARLQLLPRYLRQHRP